LKFKKDNSTLEEELEKYNKEVDIDSWENKRGPRPWEGTVPVKPVKSLNKSASSNSEVLEN